MDQRNRPVQTNENPQKFDSVKVERENDMDLKHPHPLPHTEDRRREGGQHIEPEKGKNDGSLNAKALALVSAFGGLILLIGGGVLLKDQIKAFLDLFISLVDDWGPAGYVAYILVYAGLELLALPAIPLTMTAGAIFGVGAGTAVVSIAATIAATGAFLISRYLARDRVAEWARKNPKFAAIDRAIGRDGLRVVTLLRLSPLLPLAASNYLYGLTSVDLPSYVLGSWAGMLPGTFAYVAAGTYGKKLLSGDVGNDGGGFTLSGSGIELWQVALGMGITGLAVWYVARLAKKALEELDIEEQDRQGLEEEEID
jgi:uncharacterized membrane protein YdjX (TVP38/TMEM64 family)